MKKTLQAINVCLPLFLFVWVAPASAVSVSSTGRTVLNISDTTTDAGIIDSNGEVTYFIPLRDNSLTSTYVGTYGDTGTTPSPFCGSGVGTCSDSGTGFGYSNAEALDMSIFFDLSGQSGNMVSGNLILDFDDLDLSPVNDPKGFFESLSLSYWDTVTDAYVPVGSTITMAGQLTSGVFAGASTTPGVLDDPDDDPVVWELDLISLGLLGAVNTGIDADGGFLIQLGFGSKYVYPDDYYIEHKRGKPRHGSNTPEYLTATLNVSPVPLPSAVWLFGSALLGFIGVSRRTRV